MSSFEEMLYFLIKEIKNINSIVLLWTTSTHLFAAFNLLNCWYLHFINILVVWRKTKADGNT